MSINCTVEKGLGRVIIVVITEEGQALFHIFKSPSVFSFTKNSAEILNWHRDNIISLISQYNIEGIVVKKTERTSFHSRPKNSDIFKLYMEGVMLSLAGNIGKYNKHFYKVDIQTILKDKNIFEKDFNTISKTYNIDCSFGNLLKAEVDPIKETLLAALALREKVKK
ncbi:hypothetical protein [Chitinophaga sp. W2I13]|uniref:hypothetical protein n=1 Tax=Chitinophaga sp. W2I13 TaxID=3373923 RepID=UPI003D1C6BA6